MARPSMKRLPDCSLWICALFWSGWGLNSQSLRASSEPISVESWLNQRPLFGADSPEPLVLPEPPRLIPSSQDRSVAMMTEPIKCPVPQASGFSAVDAPSQSRFRRSPVVLRPLSQTTAHPMTGPRIHEPPSPLVSEQSAYDDHQQVTQALITLIKHALRADPSLLINAYRHIVDNLPHASQEPYAQHIIRQLNRKPHVWHQLTQGVKQRCLVVFLDPTCPHSSALFHHLLSLGRSILHNWHIRPFWWSPQSQSRHTYVIKALWLLSIHGLIEPFCRAIEARGLALHHLTPALMQDILESLGINMMQFQEAMSQPMINDILTHVKVILKELNIQSFPLMICKTSGTGQTQPIATSFRVFQGCPQAKDDIWRWLTQTEDDSANG